MYFDKIASKYRIHFMHAGIVSDEQIIKMTYEELLKVRYIGHAAIEEVNQKVRIPMGLAPLVRPEKKPMHPNTRAGIDRYWAAYRRGEKVNRRFRQVRGSK